MDIYKAIRALHEERKRLDQMIASLERLKHSGELQEIRPKKRRGRKSMSPAERLAVSERMRKYWAARRQAANTPPGGPGADKEPAAPAAEASPAEQP